MKAWKLVITVVLFVTVLLPAGRSVESPVTRNPAGYGTIPQSSFRSGLVNTPNPVDPTGNLLMTGNVRRGMHFRGSVPYRSTTSFNASLGSSALNSFLRDTAGSEDFMDRSHKYRVQPFYSPTQTVTTMVPGRSEVFSPMGMRMDDRVRQGTSFVGDGLPGLNASSRGDASLDQDVDMGDSDFQEVQRRYVSIPLGISERSQNIERVDKLVPGQLGIRQSRDSDRFRDQERDARRGMEDLAIDSGQDSESGFLDSQQRQNLPVRDKISQYPGEEVSYEPSELSPVSQEVTNEIQDTEPKSNVGSVVSNDRREVLDDIRRQLDALTKSVEAGLQKDDEKEELRIENGEWRIPNSQVEISEDGRIQEGIPELRIENEEWRIPNSKFDILNSQLENLESFSQSRFSKHISAAEDHLKAGRYYRAVDSFTLAAIYQPNNPVVLAGKSHALFAAGEYMSSALFLTRALAVRPEYTQTKVDFAAMLGGADKLAERIADVEQWLARSGSAQLQFLLSYVYFHTVRLNQAKQAITAAYEKMPDSPPVVALRTAINQAVK